MSRRMHPMKRLSKIIAECEQMVRDIQWWNNHRLDAEPLDCEDIQVFLQMAYRCRAAWNPSDTREYGRISREMVDYAKKHFSGRAA